MKQINPDTKISVIIKSEERSIDAIASIAPAFRRLQNPILRRIMAPRVTLAQAAIIGKCSIDDFKRVLEPLGFEVLEHAQNTPATENRIPNWLSYLSEKQKRVFDVRDMIQRGEDPLKQILEKYKGIPSGHALGILNSFIPFPLIQLIEKKGAITFTEILGEDIYRTWFLKKEISTNNSHKNNKIEFCSKETFESILSYYAYDQIIEIDVRQLPAPEPMEKILSHLSDLPCDQILLVRHQRVPLHLLEELDDSAYKTVLCEFEPEDIRLLISNLS